MIGAGDCSYCGGDVVFDLHGGRERDENLRPTGWGARLRAALRRRRRD